MRSKDLLNKQLVSRRTFIIGAGKIGLLFLLAGRMFYMQFIKKDEYRTLSDKNRIKLVIIPPTRGQIYDCNNNIIAKNNSCFRLLLDKNITTNYSPEINLIAQILELDQDQINDILAKIKKGGYKLPIMIIDCLDWQQISIIEERKPDLKSAFIDTGFDRFYKNNKATSHILGYMGRAKDKEQKTFGIIDESFKVGKTGIENYYENILRGEFGYKQIEVNAYGKYVRQLVTNNSRHGQDLYLNIDADIQEESMSILSPQGASSIVMNCKNGKVLILTSSPGFDPNKFNKLSSKYWHDLINDPYKPLINKTINSLYPPGSSFKIITALAALEHGVDPEEKLHCSGGPILGGNSFRCSRLSGHGYLNMNDALKHSCNHYIYSIAMKIGPDRIINMAKKFGFGSKTGIDLPDELEGFVPTTKWKKDTLKTKWTTGDTLNLSIGQGFLLCSPIQLASLISTIASNGKLFVPQIAKSDHPPIYQQLKIKQTSFDIIKTALYHVINTPGGTGYLSRLNYNDFKMAGKTGTAQVQAKKNARDNLSRLNIAWNRRNHASFCGFAPYNDPTFAVAVYFDHGGGGGRSAAPIARKIMLDVLKKHYYSNLG
jgi:penicillin-binding protein 2